MKLTASQRVGLPGLRPASRCRRATVPSPPLAGLPAPSVPDRIVVDRQTTETAGLRCLCYAACSELVASPHDVDPRPSLRGRVGLGEAVPHASPLEPLLAEVSGADLARLRAEYSGMFEVGSQGPPAPIREDLQTGQRAGTREEVVRFYEYFGYVLDDKFAGSPTTFPSSSSSCTTCASGRPRRGTRLTRCRFNWPRQISPSATWRDGCRTG